MNEPQKHGAQGKKSDTEEFMLQRPHIKSRSGKLIYRDKKQIAQGLVLRRELLTTKNLREIFGVM